MKTKLQVLVWVAIVSTALFVSCQNEEAESTVDETQTLNSEAPLTNLLQRVATDFVEDNDAIDSTSCFTFKIPFTVYLFENSVTTPPGVPFTVNNDEDLGVLTNLIVNEGKRTFNQYPLTLVYEDASEVVVNGDGEYQIRQLQCGISNPGGDCLTLAYPITVFGYNSDFQFADTYLINSSSELFLFLLNLNPNEYYALDYPLSVVNASGQTVSVSDNNSLEAIIQDAITACQPIAVPTCIPSNLANGLIAYYPFSAGSLEDFIGTAHLTNTTSAHPGSDRNGNSNCAFEFDSSNNEFLRGTAVDTLNGLTELSISLWYQPGVVQSDYELLVGRDDGLHCPDTNGQWSLGLYDGRSPVFGYKNSVWAGSSTEGTWYHVVATYHQQDNTLKIYRNGVLQNTAVGVGGCNPVPTVQDIGDLFIGKYYTGKIDDVAIYSRELTGSEVEQLFQLEPCCQ